MAFQADGKNIYTVQTAEKGILWFKIKSKGRPGHGSVPGAADNAIMRMNKVVEKLGNHCSEIVLVPTFKQYLTEVAKEDKFLREDVMSLLKNPQKADQILDSLSRKDKYMAEEFRARLRMTVTPTMIQGGVKENIVPSECEAVFDCRVLPGRSPAQALDEIKGLLKDVGLDKLEFEIIQANEPSESPLKTPLYELIADTLREFDPNCAVASVLLTGGTDSRFFRSMDSVCYGFHPVRPDLPYSEMQKTIHGVDERISVENLVFGTSVLYNVVERFMT
jgi:acetylornithine deacetylase/succinyl-diaminopimelate desuccinylase-like protein